MRYALLSGDKVESVILWDGETPYEPEEGYILKEAPDNVAPGWTFENDEWIPLPEVIVEVPEELQAVEDAKYQALAELTALGVSEATARTIVGLPPAEEPTS